MKDQIAILRIGHNDVVLPADKAMKAMQLLAGAVHVSRDYEATLSSHHRMVYRVGNPVELGIDLAVRRDQFRTVNDEPCDLLRPRPIGRKQNALEGPKR